MSEALRRQPAPTTPSAALAFANVLAVAFSGGRDSTALAYATARLARALGLTVVAVHVHHGLSPNADAWAAHCVEQCDQWRSAGLPIHCVVHRVAGRPSRGESVEAWARGERHRALQTCAVAHGATALLLAHHQQDQAETFLLQALRGAGTAGLAAMPKISWRDGLGWMRPWLRQPRAHIERYARAHGLRWVDDDSNSDPRFARNRLRLTVWPALTQAFAQAETTLADGATWAQEADACLSELAQADLQLASDGNGLLLASWAKLSLPRRANALRYWLALQLAQPAPASLVKRLIGELGQPQALRWPTPHGELRRVGARLVHTATAVPEHSPRQRHIPPREARLRIQRAGLRRVPGWGGWLRITRVASNGVPLAWLMHAELRERQGGEQFQAGIARPPRSLKKQYQAAGVPVALRNGPLIYSGGLLVFVPGLGLDARIIGPDGAGLVQLEWLTFRPD